MEHWHWPAKTPFIYSASITPVEEAFLYIKGFERVHTSLPIISGALSIFQKRQRGSVTSNKMSKYVAMMEGKKSIWEMFHPIPSFWEKVSLLPTMQPTLRRTEKNKNKTAKWRQGSFTTRICREEVILKKATHGCFANNEDESFWP